MTTTATPVLGKRKDAPLPSQAPSSSLPKNPIVDAAFQRLFGYSWGATFDLPTRNNSEESKPSSTEEEMIEIFGPARTARILNLPWSVVAPGPNVPSKEEYYNPAAILTTKIVASETASSTPVVVTALQTDSMARGAKKRRLEAIDYKSIALPKHMVSSGPSQPKGTEATKPAAVSASKQKKTAPATSKLDSVLSQIAGKKQLNTVEKTSNDWEGFKEQDKTLQDELERNAQSKNAYLVKQDFLNRVDHRKFELEKEERDRERSRRAAESK